jgi:hypothetical protein
MGIMCNRSKRSQFFLANSSSSNLLSLPLIIRIDCIRGASKRSLNGRPRLRSNIEFRKLRSDLEDVYTRGVENLFGWRYGYGEVCVFGEARDEEHEATGLDLHFGEVCAAGGNVGMPSVVICFSLLDTKRV